MFLSAASFLSGAAAEMSQLKESFEEVVGTISNKSEVTVQFSYQQNLNLKSPR